MHESYELCYSFIIMFTSIIESKSEYILYLIWFKLQLVCLVSVLFWLEMDDYEITDLFVN